MFKSDDHISTRQLNLNKTNVINLLISLLRSIKQSPIAGPAAVKVSCGMTGISHNPELAGSKLSKPAGLCYHYSYEYEKTRPYSAVSVIKRFSHHWNDCACAVPVAEAGGSLPALNLPKIAAEPTQITKQPTKTAPAQQPAGDAELSIEAVVGVGNRDLEYILVRNQGETTVDLAGWEISVLAGSATLSPR